MALYNLFTRILTSRTAISNRIILYETQNGLKQDIKTRIEELNIPEKPRKPLSSYLKYVNERRPIIRRENPQLKLTEISRKCAEEWRSLDTTTKQNYDAIYKKEMEEYAKKAVAYSGSLTSEQKEALKELADKTKKDRQKRELRKLAKETNKPKRPLGPYMFYILEQVKIQNSSLTELLKEQKGKWATLPEAEKKRYEELARHDKERYKKEIVEWRKRLVKDGRDDVLKAFGVDETLHERVTSRLIKPKHNE